MPSMRRSVLFLATLLVAVAMVPAVAHANVLATTMDQPNDVEGINSDTADTTNWLAQSFTPTDRRGASPLLLAQTQLHKGRYRITIVAVDAAGNGSKPRVVKLSVRRP
jgi:hypothetical protein